MVEYRTSVLEALGLILSIDRKGGGRRKERRQAVGSWFVVVFTGEKQWNWAKGKTKGGTEAEISLDGIAAPGLGLTSVHLCNKQSLGTRVLWWCQGRPPDR